jgi:2-aminoadipate transaminase
MTFYGQYTVQSAKNCVNFGVGQPSKRFLPLNLIKQGVKELFDEDDVDLLQYGDIPGFLNFRENLSDFLNKNFKESFNKLNLEQKKIIPDDLFTTNGVTQGLSLLCTLFLKAGDTIFVEDPTYFLARNIFAKDFNLNVVSISMESDGINIEELKEKLNPDGNNYLYTIPTFHNPTGITMSYKKRLELCNIPNLTIFSDEVYQLLYFDEPPPPSLSLMSENVISLGSFSKILAPSLRLGWIHTSDKYMKVLKECGIMDSSGGLNPITAAIVNKLMIEKHLDSNLLYLRQELKECCDSLYDGLKKNLPENIEIKKPIGGYFIWFKLGININKSDVKVHYGNKFSDNKEFNDYVRLSFSYYTPEELILGAERLGICYNNNIIVGIQGSRGKFGSLILKELQQFYEIEIIEKDTENFNSQIIIDVSSPEGTINLINKLKDKNIPLIIGTTGIKDNTKIKSYSNNAPVAYISNFTEGIPIIIDILQKYRMQDSKYSITETHHTQKKDSPSGTAITLKNNINSSCIIKSIREGNVVGEHIVTIENDLESIEIKHTSKDRKVFAKNVLSYIPFLIPKKNGLYYGLQDNLKFTKYSGCGNDFIIIDNRDEKFNLNVNELCSRGKSIGSDGLILIEKSLHYDFKWNYYNSDGNLVEMCGNGARCAAHFAYNNHICNSNNDIKFINSFGIITTASVNDNNVKVNIDAPVEYIEINKDKDTIIELLNSNDINDIIDIKMIKVGVPHLVIILDEDITQDINEIGSKINNEILSFHVNINFVNQNNYKIRTYERGVNSETYACGTGCCASMFILNKKKVIFNVKSGEILTTYLLPDNKLYLEGEVKKIYKVN